MSTSPQAGTVSYSVLIAVSLENSGDDLFTVMPNPSDDHFIVSLNEHFSEGAVTVYDVLGQLIYHQWIHSNERISIGSELAKGIYLLTISTEKGHEAKRIVKVK